MTDKTMLACLQAAIRIEAARIPAGQGRFPGDRNPERLCAQAWALFNFAAEAGFDVAAEPGAAGAAADKAVVCDLGARLGLTRGNLVQEHYQWRRMRQSGD